MPLGTLDRTPPPFFKQGPSALSKLVFFSALALFLMVADARFRITQPVRAALATALYPVQWLAMQPVHLVTFSRDYFTSLDQAQTNSEEASKKLALQSLRASQVEQLSQENDRLRKLMGLRAQLATSVVAAEVLYDAADPYTRKVIIDKGLLEGVDMGSPVVDESGVLGQVTRVHPLVSEVTLIVDRELAIPVLNVRTGARSVAYGDPVVSTSPRARGWSCVSWAAMPMCRRVTCSPPVAWTACTRPVCPWRGSAASNGAPSLPSPRSTARRRRRSPVRATCSWSSPCPAKFRPARPTSLKRQAKKEA